MDLELYGHSVLEPVEVCVENRLLLKHLAAKVRFSKTPELVT